jgi:MFS transporter, AAHS family, 4-hydroxybenzoate transporter
MPLQLFRPAVMRSEELAGVAVPRANRVHQRVAWLCGAVVFLDTYNIASAGNAVPSLVDAWKLQPAMFTQALTAGNVGLLLGLLGAGLLGDRLPRRHLIICSVLEFGVFSLLSALVHSPPQLVILRLLTGLGLGSAVALAMVIAADVAPRHSQGRFMILIQACGSMGTVFGGLLASELVRAFGWPAIFVVGGVLPIAVAPLLALLPNSAPERSKESRQNPVAALFQGGLALTTLLLWSMSLLNVLVLYFIKAWLPAILHSTGVSPARSILAASMFSLGALAGLFITAALVDKVGIERVLTYALVLGAFCVFAIGAFHLPLWLLYAVLFGAGIGGSCEGGIIALSCLAYPTGIRSTGASWAMGAGSVGSIAGPLLGGLLLSVHLQPRSIFVAAFIPALCVALLMVILGRLRHRQGRIV